MPLIFLVKAELISPSSKIHVVPKKTILVILPIVVFQQSNRLLTRNLFAVFLLRKHNNLIMRVIQQQIHHKPCHLLSLLEAYATLSMFLNLLFLEPNGLVSADPSSIHCYPTVKTLSIRVSPHGNNNYAVFLHYMESNDSRQYILLIGLLIVSSKVI